MIFQQHPDHHLHHSKPIDCQKVQGLIDLLREIHAIFMMDQFGHINGILINRIFAMRLIYTTQKIVQNHFGILGNLSLMAKICHNKQSFCDSAKVPHLWNGMEGMELH